MMMRPHLLARIPGKKARMSRKAASRFTLLTRRHSSSVVSLILLLDKTPALLTRMSMEPKVSMSSEDAAAIASASERSA